MKKAAFIILLLISGNSFAQQGLGQFKFLIGNWQGVETGVAGDGIGFRSYEYKLGENYIFQNNQSTFPKTNTKPRGEVHLDIGVFSYDARKDKVIFRSFNVEGFTNIYELREELSDESRFVFITREIENNPGNWKARLTLEKVSETEFIEKFDIATDGEIFSNWLENHWYSIK